MSKIGFWIVDINLKDEKRTWDWRRFICSDCEKWNTFGETPFCPYCGKPKERREKDDN